MESVEAFYDLIARIMRYVKKPIMVGDQLEPAYLKFNPNGRLVEALSRLPGSVGRALLN